MQTNTFIDNIMSTLFSKLGELGIKHYDQFVEILGKSLPNGAPKHFVSIWKDLTESVAGINGNPHVLEVLKLTVEEKFQLVNSTDNERSRELGILVVRTEIVLGLLVTKITTKIAQEQDPETLTQLYNTFRQITRIKEILKYAQIEFLRLNDLIDTES